MALVVATSWLRDSVQRSSGFRQRTLKREITHERPLGPDRLVEPVQNGLAAESNMTSPSLRISDGMRPSGLMRRIAIARIAQPALSG
jgi:hypothetical protein